MDFRMEKPNVAGAIKHSIIFSYSIVRSVAYGLAWLVTGKVNLTQMMGPVAIVSTIGEVVQQGTTAAAKLIYLANMTALISIAIGASNLIPFPQIDGGKLFLYLVEAIRRKPIPPEKEAFISMVGFVILVAFGIFTIFNDTIRLITGG
jgi:regulator of sigma E protease